MATIQLRPPVLSKETLSHQIIGTRPMRQGSFNISRSVKGPKEIIHIYGMGGAGYSTLFGSVSRGINLYLQQNPDKKKPIRVIGSGCIGLLTAIELSHLGYSVVGITTKDRYEIPSWQAAGYFALVSVQTSPKEQEELDNITIDTFYAYRRIKEGKHSFINPATVSEISAYSSEKTHTGLEGLVKRGLIPVGEKVTLDFGNGVTHKNYLKYQAYFINTSDLMYQLICEVNKLGIPIEINEIKSFQNVVEEVIFNCSGLGSRELNHDNSLVGVRGHMIALNEAAGTEHMKYMIYTDVEQDGKEESLYMFPKNLSVTPSTPEGIPCSSVLGGTFIPDADKLSPEDQKQLDQQEFARMLNRHSLFFTGKPMTK